MEPIVFHPGSNNDNPKTEAPNQAVDIVNTRSANTPAEKPTQVPQLDDKPPESHHKEILPSLAIPQQGTPGKKSKTRTAKVMVKTFLITYVLATAAGLATVILLNLR